MKTFTLSLILLMFSSSTADTSTVSGKAICRGIRDSRDVVVYLERISQEPVALPKNPVVLDQVNLTFLPHVLPVSVGTTVAFPNSDEVRHNVFSPSPAKRFNLGTYPRGMTKFVTFDKPGEVALLCNVHAEMSAYVIVLETPHYALTDRAGNFTIPNVPPGNYRLKVWHEKLKAPPREVVVEGRGAVSVEVELKR